MADRFAFSPETLIKAYSLGVFPMAESADSRDIRFYDPEVRALIPLAWREGRGTNSTCPAALPAPCGNAGSRSPSTAISPA